MGIRMLLMTIVFSLNAALISRAYKTQTWLQDKWHVATGPLKAYPFSLVTKRFMRAIASFKFSMLVA
jgi:hypothetical protein